MTDTCRKKPEFVAPLPIKGLTAWMTKDGLGFYGMGRNLKGRVGQLCVFGERVIVKKFPKKMRSLEIQKSTTRERIATPSTL